MEVGSFNALENLTIENRDVEMFDPDILCDRRASLARVVDRGMAI